MKKTNKRLTLRAETVRSLQDTQLTEAVGGLIIPRTQYTCEIIRCIPNSNRSVCELCVVG